MGTQQTLTQLERYKSFLEQDPDNTSLICQVVQLQLQAGEIENSKDILVHALECQPNDASLQFNLSHVLLAQNKFEEAAKILLQLDNLIDNSAIKYNLAYALVHIEKYADALDLFDSIINKDDAPIDTAYWLGRCYYYIGDIDKAEKYLSQHVDKNPRNADSLGTLAMLNMDNENIKKAQELAESALAINADNTEALVTMGNVYLDQYDDALAHDYFSRASSLHPTSGRAWSGLGLSNMMKLDIGSAIPDLKKATHYLTTHLGTWHALAWAQLVSDDISGAKETLESCLEIDRTFGETHGGLAIIDIIQGHQESAKEKIKRALRLDKTSFSANFAQSLLLQNSEPEQAKKIIENIMSTQLPDGSSLKSTLNKQLRKHTNIKH